ARAIGLERIALEDVRRQRVADPGGAETIRRGARRRRLAEVRDEVLAGGLESERVVEGEQADDGVVARLARDFQAAIPEAWHASGEYLSGLPEDAPLALGSSKRGARQLGVLPEKLLLLLRRRPRDVHVHASDEVAATAAREPAHALSPKPELRVDARSGRHGHLARAVERGNLDLPSQDERREGQLQAEHA